MERQRQYYRGGYCGEKKMMRNRCDLGYDQSTDLAVVDVIDKMKKSQLVNGGYCQQGNSGNAYESVEIYMKRTQQIPGHDQYACSKYQQMESGNNMKLEYDEEEEMLFVSRMMSHEKLRYEKWINELPNKREFLVNILQEMKKRGVQNIYDEETFIRIVFEKKAEIVGKVSCSSQQNSVHAVSEYGGVDRLSDTEMSFVKDMMSCEEIKEFSINEESMFEIMREMKKQGFKNICNKESFIRFVSEKTSKTQGFSNHGNHSNLSITKVSNDHGGYDGYNDQVVACAEFSSSEEIKRIYQQEKHKQMQRNNGGGYEIVRQEIITTYDNDDYQRESGYRGGGGYGGSRKMIHAEAGECYEDDFQGHAMQQKKVVMGQHKYQQYGGGGGYAYGRYCH
eukprot:PITA_09523